MDVWMNWQIQSVFVPENDKNIHINKLCKGNKWCNFSILSIKNTNECNIGEQLMLKGYDRFLIWNIQLGRANNRGAGWVREITN